MRVLVFTTAGSGHWLPMVPLVRALSAAGHELAACAPASFADSVARENLVLHPRPDLPQERMAAVFARMAGLSTEESNRIYMREVFGALNLEFGLAAARTAIEEFRPDLVLAEEAEVTSLVAAAEADVPSVRAAIGLAAFGEFAASELAREIGSRRHAMTPGVLRLSPVPEVLDGGGPVGDRTRRFRAEEPVAREALPDWWNGSADPMLYMTLGSEAGRMPFFPSLVARLYEAVAERPVRVLFTTGHLPAPDLLPPPPGNVHVEAWFPQGVAMDWATAVVAHGGFGTMLAALAAGVPSVKLPLFALDQHWNARRVEEVGAGVAVHGGVDVRPSAIVEAIDRVLADPAFSVQARAVAAAMAALPPVASAVAAMESLVS